MFIAFWFLRKILRILKKKKDQVHSVNILQVIGSEKCGCLNDRKLLIWNTLQESTFSRVQNTAEIYMAALLP